MSCESGSSCAFGKKKSKFHSPRAPYTRTMPHWKRNSRKRWALLNIARRIFLTRNASVKHFHSGNSTQSRLFSLKVRLRNRKKAMFRHRRAVVIRLLRDIIKFTCGFPHVVSQRDGPLACRVPVRRCKLTGLEVSACKLFLFLHCNRSLLLP